MIEVFKTNVQEYAQAAFVMHVLRVNFPAYDMNFDLDDCDKILRIKTEFGIIDAMAVIQTLCDIQVKASVLPDEISIVNINDVLTNPNQIQTN